VRQLRRARHAARERRRAGRAAPSHTNVRARLKERLRHGFSAGENNALVSQSSASPLYVSTWGFGSRPFGVDQVCIAARGRSNGQRGGDGSQQHLAEGNERAPTLRRVGKVSLATNDDVGRRATHRKCGPQLPLAELPLAERPPSARYAELPYAPTFRPAQGATAVRLRRWTAGRAKGACPTNEQI
jgi:hypothetical protein